MIWPFVASALRAGVLAGLLITGLQQVTTAPLIHQAEKIETAAAGKLPGHGPAVDRGQRHGHGEEGRGWAPADGVERLFFTALANVIAGTGFALVLVACLALWNGKSNGQTGVLWGIAGFTVFTLAPSLGLAPELPTMNAAGLMDRQIWWIGTASATAAGLWLMVFPRKPMAAAAGIVVIAVPHIVGAPHPHDLSAQIPPELAARFAAASIGTSAVFWVALGWFAGVFYGRGSKPVESKGKVSVSL